ncbi:recombinase family protein [Enterobacter cancerogenus]|uniref:recombinase family protein n=1 Tax=Enterobacter cancerogenus TaxID=69218 RepID=UPI00142EF4C0|nr:recombinase family protein [Enterobacter cancerogenus]
MCVAIGYMRYSSKLQGGGSTIHRQKSLINKWVEDQKTHHGKVYEVKFYTDKGLSGWTGENLLAGALGRLIEEVETGGYPEGTPIILESIDRLSRQGHEEATAILRRLTSTGCVVHSILDRQVIHRSDLKTFIGAMQIIAVAERGREESDIKSERVSSSKKRNYELAKLGKKLVTKNLPGWIYLDQKGKMQIDPVKQKLVQEIFEMRLAGHTYQGIAEAMTNRGEPVLNERKGAQRWLPNSIRTLLHSRSVIGVLPASKVNEEYKEIEDYFPSAITKDLFYAVNDLNVPAVRSREKKQYPETVFLFKGLVKCRYCKGNVFMNGAKPGYWGRIRCIGHHDKVCDAPSLPRYDFEQSLITRIFPLLKSMDVRTEKNPVAVLQAKIDHLTNILEGYYDDLEEIPREDKPRRKTINERISKRANEKEEYERQLVVVRRKMEVRIANTLSDLNYDDYSDRLKMQLVISRNIERIVLDSLFDKVHIKLVNGNALMNFPLYGDVDGSRLVITAKENTGITDVERILGLDDAMPTVYNLAPSSGEFMDDREFPEVEPDYPNEEQ